MNRTITLLVLSLLIFSCKPVYNLDGETSRIVVLAQGDFSNEEYFENIPNSVKDSIPKEKFNKYLDSIRNTLHSVFYKKEDIVFEKIEIKNLSSTRKINNQYFKLIEYSKSLKIKKNESNIFLQNYKIFLDSELMKYNELNPGMLETTFNGYILTYWSEDSKKWKYLIYNDSYNEKLFGLISTQKIIDLYFDDIFIKQKTNWDKESISIFREVYEENRDEYTKDGIDFEKFLNCRMKYQQKAEEKFGFDIPDKYYESSAFIEHSLKCRIYSKTN